MDLAILRLGVAFTFLLGGIFIFKDLKKWEGMFLPWVIKFSPITQKKILKLTGIWDIFLSVWLFSGITPWVSSSLMAISLIVSLFMMGITYITFRDIGLIIMCVFLSINSL